MALEVGRPNEDYRPANVDPHANIRGTHSSHSFALNIPNPEPGKHYYWCAASRDQIQSFQNRGWSISQRNQRIQESDPTRGMNLDTTVGRVDVVLMEIDDEGYRRFKQAKADAARRRSPEAATDEYLARNSSAFASRHAGHGDVYWKGPGHAIDYESQVIPNRNK